MRPVGEVLNRLCGRMIVVLVSLLLDLIILVHKLRSRPITTRQYLKFIEEKNPTICYTKRLKAEHEAECRVCLSEFKEGEKVRNLKCKHTFHRDCLDKWLQEYWATCPLCRKQVLPHDVVSKHRQHRNQVEAGVNGNEYHLPFLMSAFQDGNTSHRYL
ncbi:hypothetical protein VNO77_43878 [Canavalia gladiata]|uniref:RING-type domain-containing protein n=1 Tax=Canavalia gladiata TaxID=3824 RepID=A0AAN9JV08_CANGL